MASGKISSIAERLNFTPAQVFFQFLIAEGITPLTGTTSPIHMTEDLVAAEGVSQLTVRDIQSIRDLLEDS
jgi:diketogulonate reductase-like aldo/keto reductase